jgi:hypothetical protein
VVQVAYEDVKRAGKQLPSEAELKFDAFSAPFTALKTVR